MDLKFSIALCKLHVISLGFYILAAQEIIQTISQHEEGNFILWVGYYEIYQGHLYDLLNERKKLFAREDGRQQVIISGLYEVGITSVAQLMKTVEAGTMLRSTGKIIRDLIFPLFCLDSSILGFRCYGC